MILIMLITVVRVFWQIQLRRDVGDAVRWTSRSDETLAYENNIYEITHTRKLNLTRV